MVLKLISRAKCGCIVGHNPSKATLFSLLYFFSVCSVFFFLIVFFPSVLFLFIHIADPLQLREVFAITYIVFLVNKLMFCSLINH